LPSPLVDLDHTLKHENRSNFLELSKDLAPSQGVYQLRNH
jgi:hypothetical protein